MSDNLLDRLNPGISQLNPYEPGRPIERVIEDYGITNAIKLASNENPLGPSPKAKTVLGDLANDLHLYPDGSGEELRNAIGKKEGVHENEIILGNGSNDIIDLCARAFLNYSTSAVASKHAFIVYKIVTQASGSRLIEVPTVNWSHDLEGFTKSIDSDTRVRFIANPNNPTGTYNSHREVKQLMKSISNDILVVLDCAYFEYVTELDYVKPIELLKEFNNIMITKSFSKIQGLASLRIGYGLSSPKTIEALNRIRQPFNTNYVAQKLALASLNDNDHIKRSLELNNYQKDKTFDNLINLGLEVIPSSGNFLSFTGNFNSINIFERLMQRGIIIRPIDLYDMPNYLRVTIGTEEENTLFLNTLSTLLK